MTDGVGREVGASVTAFDASDFDRLERFSWRPEPGSRHTGHADDYFRSARQPYAGS